MVKASTTPAVFEMALSEIHAMTRPGTGTAADRKDMEGHPLLAAFSDPAACFDPRNRRRQGPRLTDRPELASASERIIRPPAPSNRQLLLRSSPKRCRHGLNGSKLADCRSRGGGSGLGSRVLAEAERQAIEQGGARMRDSRNIRVAGTRDPQEARYEEYAHRRRCTRPLPGLHEEVAGAPSTGSNLLRLSATSRRWCACVLRLIGADQRSYCMPCADPSVR